MSEPTGQPAPAQDNPAPTQDVPAIESFIDKDGNFKEGWEKAVVPEDFQGLGVFKTFTDLKGMAKQLGNLEKLRGRQGKGVMPITDESTPTERDMFYDAIGRPKSAAEYKLEPPKELEQYFDAQALSSAKEAMHKAGLSNSQAAALMQWQSEQIKSGLEKMKAQQEKDYADGLAELNKRWGAAVNERTQIVQNVLRDYMPPGDKEAVEEAINRNPYIADLLSNIGKKFMEAKSVNPSADTSGAMTPIEAKNRMQELIIERSKEEKWKNPARFDRLSAEIRKLSEMAVSGQR